MAPAAAPIPVRVAVSEAGAKRLGELRVLRLLDIELDERTRLDPRPTGPLGEDSIRVWIDVPSPQRAVVEVQRTDRPLSVRRLAIGSFPADIAARVVAIATSELVGLQARPRPVAPPPPPALAPATPPAAHLASGLTAGAGLQALWLPESEPGLVVGPELGVAHRVGPLGQALYARWLASPATGRALRWFEVGVGSDLRLALSSPRWRLRLGAKAGAAALWAPEASTEDGTRGAAYDWTVRAAGVAGVDLRLDRRSWVALAIEPGAALRTVELRDERGAPWQVGGFGLGVSLALGVDHPPER
ncbi:MAG: hypothetical protein HY744_12330 [Deltaproteobacteria bacterium]|nr:hypothetical protein [Deltaproteobacteria bacterium]